MTSRTWLALAATAAVLLGPAAAPGQPPDRRALARELAHEMLDPAARRAIEEQVGSGIVQAMAATLEERLSRRLLEVEWRMLSGIARRFLDEALPASRMEELAADIYLRHFDEAELRELVRFQRSDLGRKVRRLTADLGRETALAIDRELRTSPALPAMLAELRRAFPVLGTPESP